MFSHVFRGAYGSNPSSSPSKKVYRWFITTMCCTPSMDMNTLPIRADSVNQPCFWLQLFVLPITIPKMIDLLSGFIQERGNRN
jgi:hypothetical protein